jgi:hypothetical protein
MNSFLRSSIAVLFIVVAAAFSATETPWVGTSTGRRTVAMDCGSGAYIVGVAASAGQDNPLGFNLVRRIRFRCRAFSGTTPGSTISYTTEAVGDKASATGLSAGSGDCASNEAMTGVTLYAGWFIDRLSAANCATSTSSGGTYLTFTVGGTGGTKAGFYCPPAQALYRVDARVGDQIDSMKGYCRSFGSISSASIPEQISSSISPKPTTSSPVAIPIHSSKTFSFNVANYTTGNAKVDIGVSGETDLLGGAAMNPPEFKLELLNPAGAVVTSKTVTNATRAIYSVTYSINANGTWKLRVTNLKQQIGTMNVIALTVMASL